MKFQQDKKWFERSAEIEGDSEVGAGDASSLGIHPEKVALQPVDGRLRENCFSALTCLYLAVEKRIADDVNKKVKAYIRELEMEKPSIDTR